MNSKTLLGALVLAFASTSSHAGNIDINAFVTSPIEAIQYQTGRTQVAVGSTFTGANFHLVNANGVAQVMAFSVGIDLIVFGTVTPGNMTMISLQLLDSFDNSVSTGQREETIATVASGSGVFDVGSVPFSTAIYSFSPVLANVGTILPPEADGLTPVVERRRRWRARSLA